jgi:AraC-like DNA-binding protein
MASSPEPDPASVETADDARDALVRVDALRRSDELVASLGGDVAQLFARVQLDPAMLANRHAMLSLRALAALFDKAAMDLACRDFALRLAALQNGENVLGPLDIAMRHSRTLGDAFAYCAAHFQAYSPGLRLWLECDDGSRTAFLGCEALLPRQPGLAAVMDHTLLMFRHVAANLSGGQCCPREVRLREPQAGEHTTYFGCPVHSGAGADGLVFALRDFAIPIPGIDPLIYALATSFVETRYPPKAPVLSARVRANIERLLQDGQCTSSAVAAMLGMHPRTLQRRLRAEGKAFEAIKDDVRRELASRYLTRSELPLIRVAELLGYAETSVLSRSCLRWFAASPRQVRAGAG